MENENNSKLGKEIMRMLAISRGPQEKLLDEALAGREATADSVSRLMRFVITNFGQEGSDTVDKFWVVAKDFLEEAGVDARQLQSIRRPFPVYGEKGFKSVLEEFET
jgi:hypothetical protein